MFINCHDCRKVDVNAITELRKVKLDKPDSPRKD